MSLTVPRTSSDGDYDLYAQVGHLLRRAHQRASSIFSDQMAVHELTPLQFAALVQIGLAGEISQNALGRKTAMDPATIHGVTGRLRERELIQSRADADDRRRTLISLTGAGEKLVAASIPVGKQVSEQTLAPLEPAEQELFLSLLKKLAKN